MSFVNREVKMDGRRFTPHAILISVFALTTIAGCGAKDKLGELSETVESADLRECESKMQLTFPVSIEPIGIWKTTEPQTTIKLKFLLPERELRVLLNQSPVKGKTLSLEQSGLFGPNMEWWDPGPPNQISVATARLEDGSDFSIGVVRGKKRGQVVVYLAWVAS